MTRVLLKRLVISPLAILDILTRAYSWLIGLIHPGLRFVWLESQAAKNAEKVQRISHQNADGETVTLSLAVPNWLCRYRATSFSQKEPETLRWLDQCDSQTILFDIGANVGLYSVYAAKSKNANVYAFEPSIFNLPALSRNINYNDVQEKVHIVANPLSDNVKFADFKLSNLDEGGALSAFGVNYDQFGKSFKSEFSYHTLGFTLDFLIESKLLPHVPNMVKVDVDGIEHLILDGARKTLKNKLCQTVLIEVNDNFAEQAKQTASILGECGFTLKERFIQGYSIHNQIWTK